MNLQFAATCFGFLGHLQAELKTVCVCVYIYMYIYIYICVCVCVCVYFNAVKDEISFTLMCKLSIRILTFC